MGDTAIVAIVGFVAIGIAVATIAMLAWAFRDESRERSRWRDRALETDGTIKERDETITQITNERSAERAGRLSVEAHRDRLLVALRDAGDPSGIADGIRLELSALQGLSDLPGAAAGATGEDREGD